MRVHPINCERLSTQSLLERLEIDGYIACLLVGQSKIGHIRLWLHGCGRFDPMNQMLRIIWKFAGNKSAVRPLVERGADHSLSIGDPGNDVAGTTAELLDGCLSTVRRADGLCAVDRKLRASDTAGQQPDGSDNQPQPEDFLMNAHRSLGCESIDGAFSSGARTSLIGAPPNECRKTARQSQRPLWWRSRTICGVFSALFLAVPFCLCQQQPSPPDGKQIFLQYCAKCHGEHGEGVSAAVSYAGPSLQAEHNSGNVVAAMEIGPEHMPRFEYVLSGDQMRAVAKYVTESLAIIPLTGGDVSEGGELYRTYCASCHRTDVRGGALGFVGTNAPSLANKSGAIIAGAIRWGPGPMPSFPSSVLNDQQVASIVDYVVKEQQPASPGGSPMNWYGPVAEGYAAWIAILVLVLFCVWTEHGGKG